MNGSGVRLNLAGRKNNKTANKTPIILPLRRMMGVFSYCCSHFAQHEFLLQFEINREDSPGLQSLSKLCLEAHAEAKLVLRQRRSAHSVACVLQKEFELNKSVNALLWAQALSILGSAISAIAIPWLLLESHIDPSKIALVFVAQSCAALLAALLGTPFLDRIEKKSTYILCDILLACCCFTLIMLHTTKALNPVLIAAILACSAVVSAFSSAAGSAMIPELLKEGDVNNQRVNGLIGTFHNFGDLLGPLIGGLLIASLGVVTAIMLDGATFLLSALLLALFVPKFKTPPAHAHEAAPGKHAYLAGVKEIAHTPVLRNVTLISAIINMVITPLLVMLLPFLVKSSGGSALNAGVLISCFGVGAFIASLLFSIKNSSLNPMLGLFGSVTLAFLCFLLLPLASNILSYLLLFLIGFSVGYLGPLEQTLMQNSAQESQIGRVMLAYSAFRTLFVPIGFLLTGYSLSNFGLTAGFYSLALILAIGLACLLYSRIKDADDWRF